MHKILLRQKYIRQYIWVPKPSKWQVKGELGRQMPLQIFRGPLQKYAADN